MEDTSQQEGFRAAAYMAAIARTLSNADVDLEAFIDRVELIVSGSTVNLITLLHWAAHVRATGLPILLFSPHDASGMPQIALVADVDGRTNVVENRLLWMVGESNRVHLIPDNFEMGAFVLEDDLRFRRVEHAPERNFEHAVSGIKRAYARLEAFDIQQTERGGDIPVSERFRGHPA